MRSTDDSRQDVARQLTGISHILQSVAEQASHDIKAEIEQATRILENISSRCPRRLPLFESDCDIAVSSSSAIVERQVSFEASHVVTRRFPIDDFTNVDVDCAFIFEISAGDAFSVAVDAYEGLLEYISVAKSGDTLKLSLEPVRFGARPVLEARITMPTLKRLRQGAATKGMVFGFRTDDPLSLYLSGAGALNLDVEVGDAKVEVSGASKLTGDVKAPKIDLVLSGASTAQMAGTCSSLVLSAWGAADADVSELQTDECTVYLKGASQAIVRAARRLDIDLSGASSLKFFGAPHVTAMNLSGASILTRVDSD